MPRETLTHPTNPSWRISIHPTSPLYLQQCSSHGSDCVVNSSSARLRLHHIAESWTEEDRDAHPVWTHDLLDLCESAINNSKHRCDEVCAQFEAGGIPTNRSSFVKTPTIFDEIAYFHGSSRWDDHWDSPPDFSLHPDLTHLLTPSQIDLVNKHLRLIGEYYSTMEASGFFEQTAGFVSGIFHSVHPQRPLHPTSAFGAGFSGFDRIDERGWDRAGYEATEDHSPESWELRSRYQIAYFVLLGRLFQMPAGFLVAYDPCYSIVDVVLLASLGIRAFRKRDPGLSRLRKFTSPTLFYAPGAEQHVFCHTIQRTENIQNLIILSGDASWCAPLTDDFTAHYARIRAPQYLNTNTEKDGELESPCGEDNCLQWIPHSRIEAFHAARGPASEPAVLQVVMPDGSLEFQD
ncbi:SRR1 domain-containing protein [Favolaschia claudopus]|uniref:SRR1 domain-containing protein n=1 Tax=Favolaschia claudopus TaxID=2862362 RepID=A0AAW0DDJ1_9AGAR